MPAYSDKICGDCEHWHRNELERGKAVDMSQPATGLCRWGPMQATLFFANNGGIVQACKYPDLKADTGACSQFVAREVSKVNGPIRERV